jgi:hypothetical protein
MPGGILMDCNHSWKMPAKEGGPPHLIRAHEYRVLATTAFAWAARYKSLAEQYDAQNNTKDAVIYWKFFAESTTIGHQYLVLAEFTEGKSQDPQEPESN